MPRLVKGLKTDSKEVEGGRCKRVSDEKLCFCEKGRGNVWKDYIIIIIIEHLLKRISMTVHQSS